MPDLISSLQEMVADQSTITGPEFTVEAPVLLDLLTRAGTTLPTSPVLPVMSNFLVGVNPDGLSVVASDLELATLTRTSEATVTVAGAALLPGKKLMEICRSCRGFPMQVSVNVQRATISCEQASWTLQLMDYKDYPTVPPILPDQQVAVDRFDLIRAIRAVAYAVARQSKPSMRMINVKDGSARATDGARYASIPLDLKLDISLPVHAIAELLKFLFHSTEDAVTVAQNEHRLAFMLGGDIFSASRLVAEFPDVDQLLVAPALKNQLELAVDRLALIDAVRRVRILADPETAAIRWTLSKDLLLIETQDRGGNIASERIAVGWSGGNRSLGLHHGHLFEALSSTESDDLVLMLGADTKAKRTPVVLRDDDAEIFCVLQQYLLAGWK